MRPKIILDTSVFNKVEDGGPVLEPVMKGLESGFEVILTAMSADEIIATKRPERREALLSRFGRLLYSAKCIWPPHEIIKALVSARFKKPSEFDWAKVNVRARECEAALPRRDFPEALLAEQREHQLKAPKELQEMWKKLRPELEAILARDPSKRPTSYREAIRMAAREAGVLWAFGQALYGHVSVSEPTEAEVRGFMDACPPFRAACYGLVMAWYSGSLRVQDGTPTAGRNDLMMAVYLPYCSRFVTADEPQRKELREIASEAQVECEVLSLEEFDRSLAVVA